MFLENWANANNVYIHYTDGRGVEGGGDYFPIIVFFFMDSLA